MIYRVLITDEALARIREQARYIAVEAQAPETAHRWLARVLAAANTLEHMPRRCRRAPEDHARPFEVRALNVGGFLLLFTINDDTCTVLVLTARHGRQRPRPHDLPDRPLRAGE